MIYRNLSKFNFTPKCYKIIKNNHIRKTLKNKNKKIPQSKLVYKVNNFDIFDKSPIVIYNATKAFHFTKWIP